MSEQNTASVRIPHERFIIVRSQAVTDIKGDYVYWVIGEDGRTVYKPQQAGDSGQKACQTYLRNRGYVPVDDFGDLWEHK